MTLQNKLIFPPTTNDMVVIIIILIAQNKSGNKNA